MSPADPTPIRQGQETASQKIERLQREIGQTIDHALIELKGHLFAAAQQAAAMQNWPMHVGEKEELRKIGTAIESSLDTLTSIAGRK